MRHISLILCLCITLYSQDSPAIWWDSASQDQRDFAAIVYRIGFNYGDKGHTLTSIAWMESGLGSSTNHDEDSYGYFGLSEMALLDVGSGLQVFDSLKSGTLSLEAQAVLALDYFALCEKRLKRLGISTKEARFWAYPRYNAGKNWRNFKRRGEVFRERTRFLVRRFR